MKRYFLASLMLLVTPLNVRAEDYVYEVPNTPPEHKSRLKIRSTGIILVDELFLDGAPFAYFRLEEVSGNPLVFWLTKDKFAFLGCGGPHPCDNIWRVGKLSTKTQQEIKFASFESKDSWPVFLPPYMAYQGRFSNGNLGCIVYDWKTEKNVARWDSGRRVLEGMSIGFGKDRSSVTCSVIVGWEPNLNADGDAPQRFPIYGKSHTERFSSKDR